LRYDEIEKIVLDRIKPSKEEYEKGYRIYNKVKEALERGLKRHKIPGKVSLQGSFAKDTWISGELDLDVFVLFPEEYSREWLETTGFRIILESLKDYNYIVKYAAHPYITVKVEDVDVDVVPAFDVRNPAQIKSAVDRTPYHTKYVNSKLTLRQRDEVRLLKKFMKGIGVYGAEIKVEGFSGYLVELLIIHYGSFRSVLTEASEWQPPVIIDIEGYHKPRELVRKFRNKDLVVVDPVDPNRNVAAAVSRRSFATFIAASRRYLEKPSLSYFFPSYPEIDLLRVLSLRKTSMVVVLFDISSLRIAPDILWGELKRTMKGLVRFIESNDFKVIDYDSWSNEKDLALIIIELEERMLSPYTLHIGPPVHNREYSDKFIKKYLEDNTVYGPWISFDGRWRILKPRRYRDVHDLLQSNIKALIKAPDLSRVPVRVVDLLELKEIIDKDEKLRIWINRFVYKKPSWLL